VINYIKGPRYLVNNITDEEAKPNDTKTRFNQMFELPREDNLLFGVIPKTIMLKYDKENNRYDLDFSSHAENILGIINGSQNWHKYFVAERAVFVFKREFDGQPTKWVLRQKVEDLLNKFSNKALSKSLYLKLLVSQECNEFSKSTPVDRFCLIKYRWLTKHIISFKIGLYSSVKFECEDNTKDDILVRIAQELALLDGIRISNSILNVFVFNPKKTLQINQKFATTKEEWESCACLVDFTPFFLNLNHAL